MKKLPGKILFPIALVLLCGGCASKPPGEMKEWRFVSSRDPKYNWGGTEYLVLVYEQDGCHFLQSFISGRGPATFTRSLGKNVMRWSNGLFFRDGKMCVEYTDGDGEEQTARVPFGDFYGDIHISQMPGRPLPVPQGDCGKKCAAAPVLRKDESAAEAFLPTLQKHLRSDDAEKISLMIRYPVEAEISWGKRIWLEDRNDFLKYYPDIFTGSRKRELLALRNRDLRRGSGELMIGRRMRFFVASDGKAYFSLL